MGGCATVTILCWDIQTCDSVWQRGSLKYRKCDYYYWMPPIPEGMCPLSHRYGPTEFTNSQPWHCLWNLPSSVKNVHFAKFCEILWFAVCLSVFRTISQKPIQPESPNLTQKCPTTSPGNPFILGAKGQRSRSRVTKRFRRGSLHSCECRLLLISAVVLAHCRLECRSAWVFCSCSDTSCSGRSCSASPKAGNRLPQHTSASSRCRRSASATTSRAPASTHGARKRTSCAACTSCAVSRSSPCASTWCRRRRETSFDGSGAALVSSTKQTVRHASGGVAVALAHKKRGLFWSQHKWGTITRRVFKE